MEIAARVKKVTISDAAKEQAEAIFEYFKSVDASGNDYLRNIQIIARAGYCSSRGMGIACSMVASYRMATSQRAEKAKSEWVGTVGERREFSAVVERVLFLPNQFNGGVQTRTIMADDAGNTLICNAIKLNGEQATVGATVRFVATVKEHATFRDCKQTTLLRPKPFDRSLKSRNPVR